nr:hypothetical protein GCM10017745_46020 [Saccharothrix mutabilis subsp. capreolus]
MTGAEVALVTVVLVFAAWLLATRHTPASAGGFALAVVAAVIVVSRGRLPRLSGVVTRLAALPATA